VNSAEGTPVGLVTLLASGGETGERMGAELALRRSETRLQSAVDLLGLALYAWDPQTNALEWDVGARAIWGLPSDSPVDFTVFLTGIHPADRARVDAAIAACLDPDGDGICEIEFRVIGIGDQIERWVSTRGQTTFEARKPVGFLGVAVDVSARRHAEQTLRDSEERFRRFGDYSANALWVMLPKTGRVEYLSAAFETIWGRSRDAMLADQGGWLETIHADDRDTAAQALAHALAGEAVVQEYRIVRPDGAVRWIRDTLFPIGDHHGQTDHVGGIAQDITVQSGSAIYVVDADHESALALCLVLHRAGYTAKTFAAGTDFLEMAAVLAPGCVVLDLQASPAGGLATLRQLRAAGSALPVIVMGRSDGNVRLAVEAMKAGAADWLEQPYEADALLTVIAAALADVRERAEQSLSVELARARIAAMSVRERQVLIGLLSGGTNKVIAKDLGISPRTVELHRASVMERLGVKTLPEAVLLAAAAGLRPKPRGDMSPGTVPRRSPNTAAS
jgi:PAS domain S-box-containing protein